MLSFPLFIIITSSKIISSSTTAIEEKDTNANNITISNVESRRPFGRLLNVFNVVKFPNDACTTSGYRSGVCFSASECAAKGGVSSGTCAQGFGVCCTFTGYCGGSTSINNTYFVSSDTDTSTCTFAVCKASDDICTIRLDFDTFVIAQPSTQQPGDVLANGRTQCQRASLSIASGGGSGSQPPVICGTNTGYHMLFEASDACASLALSWTAATPRQWDIKISQFECGSDRYAPPPGCTQYFTGATGFIQSYNYAGGLHLANQDYSACIRTERGYCSISYTQVSSTDFGLSSTGTDPASVSSATGDNCKSLDHVIIPQAAQTVAIAVSIGSIDKICGGTFSYIHNSATAATVFTAQQPFLVGFHTDGSETDTATAGDIEMSRGFNLYYSQVAC